MVLVHHQQTISTLKSIFNLPASTRVPTLSTNKVTSVAPINLVVTTLTHAVVGITTAIRPPRVEVSVVVTLGVASDLTGLEDGGGVAVVLLVEEVKGASESSGECRSGEEERLEGDHDVFFKIGWIVGM
jgi:hypothetical protein